MDPSMPSAEVLLEHREFLRRLARGILRDPDAADDVAQDAIVAALGERPRNLRGWLGKVARHLALSRRRAEARRDLRERAAARPEALPSAAEGVARLEIQRKVVDAVLALDEPYRSVVVHRFFFDLAPGEIAKRLQVPVETVRTRLRRALEQLRARLDASHGRQAWSVALLALAVPRKTPLGGIVAMSVKSKLALTAVLALACVALGVSVLSHRDAVSPRAPLKEEAKQPVGPEAITPPPVSSPVPPPVDFAAIDRDRDVHGVVVDAEGKPVVGADVRVIRYPAMGVAVGLAQVETREGPGTRTASDGSFALRVERGEEVDLRIDAKGFVPLQRRWCPAGGRVRIVMRKGVSLRVRTTGPDGQPLAGAQVVAFKGRDAEMESAGLYVYLDAVTGDDGSCVFANLLPGRELHVGAWHAECVFAKNIAVKLPDTGEAEAALCGERGRDVTGRVTDGTTGAPVVDAVVTPYPMVVPFGKSVRTDADGRYRFGGWGSDLKLYAHAKGYATSCEEVGTRTEVDFGLRPGGTVTGTVRDGMGEPIAGAFVGVADRNAIDLREAWSDEQGRFELADLAGSPSWIVAGKPGFARTVLLLDRTPLDIVLQEGRRLEGRVVGPDGQAVAGCSVSARGVSVAQAGRVVSEPGVSEERHTDDLGRFRFADLPAGRWSVSARIGERNASRDVEVGDVDVVDIELCLDEPRVDPGRQYSVLVVDDAGRPVQGVTVRSIFQPQGQTTDEQGRVTLEMPQGVDADQVLVRRHDERYATPPVATYRSGDGELRIVLHEAAVISGHVLVDGKPLAGAACNVWGPERFVSSAVTDQDGKFTLRVPAGTRIGISLSGQVLQAMQPIYGELKDVAAGTEGLVLRARRVPLDRTLVVRVVAPDGGGVQGMAILVRDARGWNAGTVPMVTDASGRLELKGLPAAMIYVRLSSLQPSPWAGPKTREIEVLPEGGEVVFTLREGKPISGTARGPDGSGARTSVLAWRGDEAIAHTMTAEDGTFTIYVPAEEPEPVRLEAGWRVIDSGKAVRGEVDGVRPGAEGVVIQLREE